MNLEFTPEEQAFRDEVRAFIAAEYPKHRPSHHQARGCAGARLDAACAMHAAYAALARSNRSEPALGMKKSGALGSTWRLCRGFRAAEGGNSGVIQRLEMRRAAR